MPPICLDAPYVWMLPICLDTPICLDAPICLDTPCMFGWCLDAPIHTQHKGSMLCHTNYAHEKFRGDIKGSLKKIK